MVSCVMSRLGSVTKVDLGHRDTCQHALRLLLAILFFIIRLLVLSIKNQNDQLLSYIDPAVVHRQFLDCRASVVTSGQLDLKLQRGRRPFLCIAGCIPSCPTGRGCAGSSSAWRVCP